MRVLILTQGQHTVVDDDVFQWASRFKWYARKRRNVFYAARNIALPGGGGRTTRYLHQEILCVAPGFEIDHIDGDGLNNLRENLRPGSHTQNMCNVPLYRNNRSGFKGVFFIKRLGKFSAYIQVNRKQTYLGLFDNKLDAARAYNQAAVKLHGKFARLNPI